jgi:hypothetical protein
MDNNDKIDFDLDFLDNNVKEKPKTTQASSKSISTHGLCGFGELVS